MLNQLAVGISLKPCYYDQILEYCNKADFCEIHLENYLEGGYHLNHLSNIANKIPITMHGVSLSLGSQQDPDIHALEVRKRIIDYINPVFVSEHAACTYYKQHLNDLLPIGLNEKNVINLANNIDKVQNYWGRVILLENLTSYIQFEDDILGEAEFLNEVAKRSGCGLLVDLNNIYIQEKNLSRSAKLFIETINPDYVKQYHLAGGEYSEQFKMIIDNHSTDISKDVYDIYLMALKKIGLRPTLYERDNNLPLITDMIKIVGDIKSKQMMVD